MICMGRVGKNAAIWSCESCHARVPGVLMMMGSVNPTPEQPQASICLLEGQQFEPAKVLTGKCNLMEFGARVMSI